MELGEGLDQHLTAIYALARRVAACYRVPDLDSDLAQAIVLELLERPGGGSLDLTSIEDRMAAIAAREHRGRRRQRTLVDSVAQRPALRRGSEGRTAPRLCPSLHRVAVAGPNHAEHGRVLLQAALKCAMQCLVQRGRRSRYAAFVQAYGARRPIAEIAVTLQSTPAAVVESLRRSSAAVERELMAQIGLSTVEQTALRDTGAVSEALGSRVRQALGAFARA